VRHCQITDQRKERKFFSKEPHARVGGIVQVDGVVAQGGSTGR
jgi:hypothetical protein